MVIDYRELNKRTRDGKYTLPRVGDILDGMHGAMTFSVIDFKTGYHQIGKRKEHSKISLFIRERQYDFLQLPIGLKMMLITFQ